MKKDNRKMSGSNRSSLIILICILVIITVLNAVLIKNTEAQRIEAEGQMRLSSIAGSVDNSLYRSECLLDSVAMQIEQIISMGGDTSKQLDEYFCAETIADISGRSDGSCFSAYAAYNGQLYINDFIPDDDFVLDERTWYVGAKKRMGSINVTDPYIDASTGEMCYSISKLLSDGSTVVGLDFNLSGIQRYIEEMNSGSSGTSLIVNGEGMIVGHSDPEYVGKDHRELDFYYELVNKVFMLYGDTFEYVSDGVKYNIFSDRTNYDWYLIVCVKRNAENTGISGMSIYIIVFMLIFAAAMIMFYISTCRSRMAAENALSVKDEFLKNMSYELKRPLSKIISRTDILRSSGGEDSSTGAEIGDAAKELSQMLDNLISMSAINNFSKTDKEDKDKRDVDHRQQTALITIVLSVTSIFAIILNTNTQMRWGNTKMQKETEYYLYQVQDWVSGNRAVLDVISESIAAQPDFSKNYDTAIAYLDDVISKYDDISVAYLCNPEWEHTVLMNNGWEPDINWHVEERQWYIDTIVSDNNFNISAPYLDEQTGLYCTTLSKIVYDSKGNFIGVLGIDYYLDKLIGILGESYTDSGYAFLTDIDGNILNHPFDEYQMKPDNSLNATELCYRTALTKNKPVTIKDYDGQRRVCLAMEENVSGFKVIVMRNVSEIYGSGILSDIMYIIVFLLCIIVVNVIMKRLTLWQAKVNRELKEAADNAISAGKAKNNFLANMSHEIRTPINAVLGMNEMIMRESTEKEIVEYAANIQSAGRTLLSVINDILDFSKIESGKMEIVPVEYDVSSLVNDIVNMIKA
ncbi:MAG: cache domain-containing protein, partial [Huintestinicola sp.]